MVKIVLIAKSVFLFLFMSCKLNNPENVYQEKDQNIKSAIESKNEIQTTLCKVRLKEMIISCGGGCALNLKEKKIESRKKNSYKIFFSQQMYISEQKSEEVEVQYNILCKGQLLEKIFDDKGTNYLDDRYSTPTQKISFKEYGESFCKCINKNN